MLYYKIEPLKALKEKGYSTYKLSKEQLLSVGTIQKLREQKPIGWENLNKLCDLLNCQPGDILAYIPDDNMHQN